MSNLKRARAYTEIIIDKVEGGYSNHSADPGGETMWGITKNVARANGYLGPMRSMPKEKAIDIYLDRYWRPNFFSKIDNHLAFHLYDCTINSGIMNAVKILQGALGLAQDGVPGPATMQRVSETPEAQAVLLFNIRRMRFYSQLKTYGTFGRGWTNRLLTLASLDWNKVKRDYGLD